jgi:hypothetical protein
MTLQQRAMAMMSRPRSYSTILVWILVFVFHRTKQWIKDHAAAAKSVDKPEVPEGYAMFCLPYLAKRAGKSNQNCLAELSWLPSKIQYCIEYGTYRSTFHVEVYIL